MIPASAGGSRALAYLLAALLLIALGAALGMWQAARHYRPLLDGARSDVASCGAARDNLEALAAEQGMKLGAMILAGHERQARAEQALKRAEDGAKADYDAANRLQQERTGGDQCAAATSIIDKVLGL
ncbi:hypothetical protein D3C77_604900 [compost metagenome]